MLNFAPAGVPNAPPLSFLRPLGSTDEEKKLIREDVLAALNDRLWTGDQIAAYKYIAGKIHAQASLTTMKDFYDDRCLFPEDEARSLINERSNKDVDLETWVVVAYIDKYRELHRDCLTWSQLGPLLFEFPSFDSSFFRGTTEPTRAGSKPKYERDLEERKSLVGIYVAHHLLHKIGIRGRPLKFVLDVLPRIVENIRTIYATGQGKSLKRVNREELFRRFDAVERQLSASHVEAETDSEDNDIVLPVKNRKRGAVQEEDSEDEELMELALSNDENGSSSCCDRVDNVNIDNTPIVYLTRIASTSPTSSKRRYANIKIEGHRPTLSVTSVATTTAAAARESRNTGLYRGSEDDLSDLGLDALDALDVDWTVFDFDN